MFAIQLNCIGFWLVVCLKFGFSNSRECGLRRVPQSGTGSLVVNGDVAQRGAWPWHAQVYRFGQYVCGGTIIDDSWILTAAHCLFYNALADPPNYPSWVFVVKVGSTSSLRIDNDTQRFTVSRVLLHPLYNLQTSEFDTGLLQLSRAITFTETAGPICLPSPDVNLQEFPTCVITGFGYTNYNSSHISENLLQGRMLLMPNAACITAALALTQDPDYVNSLLRSDSILCAGSTQSNACDGDSGGPLACKDVSGRWIEIGLVSFSLTDKCEFTVFAKVSSMVDWIRNITHIPDWRRSRKSFRTESDKHERNQIV